MTMKLLVIALLAGGCAADPGTAANPVENGGFEKWTPASKQVQGTNWCPRLPDGLPDGWPIPNVIGRSDQSAAIGLDAKVHHGGDRSLRMENGNPFSTVELTQSVSVEPNTRYQIRMWVKGEAVSRSGGAVVHIVGSSDNSKTNRNLWGGSITGMDWYKSPSPNNGTFDWAEHVFTLDALPTTRAFKISLELRNASGTLWYDDVQVIRIEKIVPVESY